MEHTIEHGPAFAWLKVKLSPGDEVQAESGAMVRMDPSVEMTTHLNAGHKPSFFRKLLAFFVALLRRFLGGETIFVNRFKTASSGEVVVAPTLSGHVLHEEMSGDRRIFVQTGSYLASTGSVDTKIRFGGLRSIFGGEGLVLLECSGNGNLWMNSYGGVVPIAVNGDFTVDTGHIVAFDGSLDWSVKSVGGMKSLFFSGEGLVCQFRGQGTVYVQSRNLGALIGWISPMLPA